MASVEDLSTIQARQMAIAYGSCGKFEPWKECSDRIYGPPQAIQTYQDLYQQGFIPEYNSDFVFVSPTANNATHEYAMWQVDHQRRTGHGVFITADIINTKPNFSPAAANNSVINHVRWNAQELPVQDGSVDMIWDRKGLLWHMADSLELRKTYQILGKYFQALKPKGSLVIDAIPSFIEYYQSLSNLQKQRIAWAHRQRAINGIPLNFQSMYPNAPGQFEESTVDKLETLHPAIWSILQHSWSIQNLGSNETRVRVLTKKI